MARVTDAEVHGIMSDLDVSFDTTPFIVTAELVVTEELEDKGLSADRLKQIVLWLAAHYVTIDVEKGGLRAEVIGEARETFAVKSGVGIQSTRYGQQAVALDTTGRLASKDKPTARFTVV